MSTQILWFATRGAGIVSLILFTAVACLGLLSAARTQSSWWPRFLTVEVHRSLALLSVAFVAVHVLTAVLDPFTHLGLAAALVPLSSAYRPLPVALGVLSVWLTAAVVVTSLVRDRIGHRAWRAIHWTSYASWPLALVHTLTAGSDAGASWLLAVAAACVLAVGVTLLVRATDAGTNRSRLDAVTRGTADPIAVEPAFRND